MSPACRLTRGGVSGFGYEEKETNPRAQEDLTLSAQVARKLLSEVINSRWFNEHCLSKEAEGTGFLFDIRMSLHLMTASLEWVEQLSTY